MVITLDRLVNVLGGYGVVSRLGAVPRSTELRDVVLPEPGVSGDVVLAIGADGVAEAVRLARAAGAVAVLVRTKGTALKGPDGPEDTAVLQVDPALPWSELAAVVYGLVLEGRETESGRGPTDLFALADSLAAAVDAPVVIEDRHAQVLGYSRHPADVDPARVRTVLGRQVFPELRELLERRGVRAQLAASDDPIFVDPAPEIGVTGRMAIAARVGRQLLGSVWVVCPQPLDGAARLALAHSARTVALHLLRSRASADLERQVEAESVTRLLEGRADAATVASRLGLPQGPLRVIAVRPRDSAEAHTGLLVAFEQATAGFGWSRPGRSAVIDNVIYTVLPGEPADGARRWVSALAAALPEDISLWAGVSAMAAVEELSQARREADECLALHEAGPAGVPDYPAYEESWNDILLQRLRAAAGAGRGPTRGPVTELLRHDAEQGTAYVATLQAWLQAQGDAVAAAARLGVHENTVRNRLRAIIRVARVDLSNPDKRLALMIELATVESPQSERS